MTRTNLIMTENTSSKAGPMEKQNLFPIFLKSC